MLLLPTYYLRLHPSHTRASGLLLPPHLHLLRIRTSEVGEGAGTEKYANCGNLRHAVDPTGLTLAASCVYGAVMTQSEHSSYSTWLQGLTVEELANERYTLRHEAQFLNLSHDEILDKENAIMAEQNRRDLGALD